MSWDPPSERFELRLQHGSVVVSGPIASGDIELRAGQRLLVNLPKAETLITEERSDATPAAASGAAAIPSPDPTRLAAAPAAGADQLQARS